MKVDRRRRAMLNAVLAGITEVEDLRDRFAVSEVTVRRDLAALASQGLLLRTYGGATAPAGPREPEPTLEQRQGVQAGAKSFIASRALACIEDNDTLLLDGGSTIAALARCLSVRSGLHVLTNNLTVLPILKAQAHIAVTVLGGALRLSSMTTYGAMAHEALKRTTVDRMFTSADGLVAGRGLCEASSEQAWLKEAMIASAAQVYVLADATKLDHASQQHWTPLPSHWTLITDSRDDILLDRFAAEGATVWRCAMSDA